VVKLAERQQYFSIKQGSYETHIQFSKRFRATYKAFEENGQGTIPENNGAMDFFHVLDMMWYADLKKQLLNNWPPMTMNEMFALTKSWVTTVWKQSEAGKAATFMTSLEQSHKNKNSKK